MPGTDVPAAVYRFKKMTARSRLMLVGMAAFAVALIVAAEHVVPDHLLRSGVPAAGVADTLLVIGSPTNMGPAPAFVGVGIFRPEAGTVEPILGTPAEPTIAADGRDLYSVVQRQADDQLRATVIDVATDTFQTRWRVDVAAPSAAEGRPGSDDLVPHLAAGRQFVYLALHRAQSPEPITIVALDRVDGFERRRWQVDVGGSVVGALQLYLSPDNTRLDLLARAVGVVGQGNPSAGQLVLFRFLLPGGQEEAPAVPVRTSTLASVAWPPRPTPDGYGVYGLSDAYPGRAMWVEFLDFASGSLERLDLPLATATSESLPFEQAASPDGRHLYVFAPSLGQLAMVDLVSRRLEQAVPISLSTPVTQAPSLLREVWGLLGSLLIQEAAAKSQFVGALQVSPDGGRVYAAGVSSSTPESRGAGVLVIDTHAWRLVDRWLPRVEPAQLLLSADGTRLFVQEPPWTAAPEAGTVHALDTRTGAELAVTAPLRRTTLHSLGELYRSTFGRGPIFSEPGAAPTITPLARLAAKADPPTTLAGRPVQIEARFVDARTGQTVSAAQSSVRYDPPAQLMAHVVRSGAAGEDVPVSLHQSAFGVYRASIMLPSTTPGSPARWTVWVDAEWADGLRRWVEVQDAIFVRPSFTGTDGRAYVLQVSSDPSRPRVDEDTRLRAKFVDPATGSPLPDNVSLIGGLPERMEATCSAQGVTTRVLAAVGHGVYVGTFRLWSPGAWQVWVTIPLAGGTSASFEAGSLDVQP